MLLLGRAHAPFGTRDTSPNASCSPDVIQQRTRPSHSSVTATLDAQPEHVRVTTMCYSDIYIHVIFHFKPVYVIDVLCRRNHTQDI